MASTRRRVASTVALVAITAALVGAGAVAAQADSGLEITTTGGTYDGSSWEIQGTASADNQGPITVTVNGGPGCTIGYAANWGSCFPGITAPGSYAIVASQDANPGLGYAARSDAQTVTIAPPSPTAESPDTVPPGGTIALTGTDGYVGATLQAVVTSPTGTGLQCTTTVTDVDWSGCDIPFDSELPPGTFASLSITQTVGGVESAASTWSVGIDNVLGISAPADGERVPWTAAGVALSGVTGSTGQIDVYLDGEFDKCTIPAPAPKSWDCGDIPVDPGTDHFFTAQQDGESDATTFFDVSYPAPDMDGPGTVAPGTPSVTYTGTAGYPGVGTIGSLHENSDGGFGDAITEQDCATEDDAITCTFDMSSLAPGYYAAIFRHYDPEDTSTPGEQDIVYFSVGGYGGPSLGCSFVPAGARISTSADVLGDVSTAAPGGSAYLKSQGYCEGGPGYRAPAGTTWTFGTDSIACDGGCSLTGLTAGIYRLAYREDLGDGYLSEEYDYLFRVPETPVITTSASTERSVVLRGTGTAGDTVRVQSTAGAQLCTTTVATTGRWACTFSRSSVGVARAIAVDPQSGGLSAYSASRTIAKAELTTDSTETPTEAALTDWILSFDGDLMDLHPGDKLTVNIAGMPAGWTVEVVIHSTPRTLATVTADGGALTIPITIPADIESGSHSLQVIGINPVGTQHVQMNDAWVIGGVDPEKNGPGDDSPQDGTDGSDAPGSGSSDRSDPGAPSGISGKLVTLEKIAQNPLHVAVAGGLALALLFLVAVPTELLNSSLSSNGSRLGRGYGAVEGALNRARDWFIKVTRSRALATAVILLLVSIVYGFVDPGFGFDLVSLRLVLSLALAYFVLTFGASWITGLIARRVWGVSGVIEAQPTIILFAIVGVVLARILDFSPGFLVGVAIGLELIQASKRISARAVFLQLCVVVGLTLVAWVGYSLFVPGEDFFGMLTDDALVAVTAEGLTGAMVAIFPLRFLDGRELWEDSKLLWGAAFLVIGTVFSLLVLPSAIEGTDVGDLGVWLLVFGVFGAVSLGTWFFFARSEKLEEKAEHEKAEA